MRYLDVTHIAIAVPDLRVAERYYCDLFDLEVAWRDTGGPVSMSATWEEIEAAGVEPVVVLLWREAFRLALSRTPGADGDTNGRLDHVGLQISAEQLRHLRERVGALGLAVLASREDELLAFRDSYGIEWELDTRSYSDPIAIGREAEQRRRRRPQT